MFESIVMVACIALAAFYSGSETGFYCINRLRLRLRAGRGEPAAMALQHMVSRPRLAISTMLIGTNIGLYLVTVLCTDQLRQAGFADHAELYSSLLLPPVLLILAEVIPKALFQHHADRLMYQVVWPIKVSGVVFYPLSILMQWLGGLPRLLFGARRSTHRPLFTTDSFRFYLKEGADQGVLSGSQRTMAENILHLKHLDVAATMTPLEQVVMLSEDAPHVELLDVFRRHRYSRIPVYEDSRDNVVGLIHVIDLACAEAAAPTVRDLTRWVVPIRKGTSVADALATLGQARQQLALVTDDAGRALGIVTVKDLVEEIVGELEAW